MQVSSGFFKNLRNILQEPARLTKFPKREIKRQAKWILINVENAKMIITGFPKAVDK